MRIDPAHSIYGQAWQATLMRQKAAQTLEAVPVRAGRTADDLSRSDLAAISARSQAIGLQIAAAHVVAAAPADQQGQIQMLEQIWAALVH